MDLSVWIQNLPLECNLPLRLFILKIRLLKIKFGIPPAKKDLGPLPMLTIEGLLVLSSHLILLNLRPLKMSKNGYHSSRKMHNPILS